MKNDKLDSLNKNNTPRRKRLKRKNRLESAKKWMLQYTGKNIVKGYSNWFGVDLICSIKELRMNGVIIDHDYEKQVIESIESKTSAKRLDSKTLMITQMIILYSLLDILREELNMEYFRKNYLVTKVAAN